MIAKIYLTAVGLLYIGLAVWCTIDPATTSKKVGLDRVGDSGKSEFLVIYGGLELGLAMIFLMPWLNSAFWSASLWACVLVHASLVGFRTISFMLHRNISSTTAKLAIGEWIILLAGIACLLLALE